MTYWLPYLARAAFVSAQSKTMTQRIPAIIVAESVQATNKIDMKTTLPIRPGVTVSFGRSSAKRRNCQPLVNRSLSIIWFVTVTLLGGGPERRSCFPYHPIDVAFTYPMPVSRLLSHVKTARHISLTAANFSKRHLSDNS